MFDQIGDFVVKYVIVLVAISILPLKWIVARVWRDRESEAQVVLSLWEDMCYVSLGIVMGNLVDHAGAFHWHFEKSAHPTLDIILVAAFNLFVIVLVHRLSQATSNQYRHWRAAGSLKPADIDPRQGELAISGTDANLRMIFNRHFAFLSIYSFFQSAVTLVWIIWVARVVSNP